MRALVWVGAVAVLVGLAYAAGVFNFSAGLHAGVCSKDEEIDAATRRDVDAAASSFLADVVNKDAKAAHAKMTEALRKTITLDQFAATLESFAPLEIKSAKLQKTYAPRTTGATISAICEVSSPDGMVSVSAMPLVAQAHLVYSTKTLNNDFALTLWLLQNGAAWEVHSFHANPSATVGLSARDLLKKAKDQDAKGHRFNAHMLLVGATFLVNRGPNFHLGIAQEAQSALKAHEAPVNLKGELPFTWKFDGKAFTVERVQFIGGDNQLGLLIVHRDAGWDEKDDADGERRNKAFIDGFIKEYPEFGDTFGFLAARIGRPGGAKVFGTVYYVKTGYLNNKPAPSPDP